MPTRSPRTAPGSAASATRRGAIRSTRSSTPRATASLLEVAHDMDELAKTPAAEWKRLFRERAHSSAVAVRLGRVGQEGVGAARTSTTSTSSRCTRATRTCSGPTRYGRQLGLDELWIKQCGNTPHRLVQGPRHDRARVDGERDDRSAGSEIRAVACASTGDTSAALAAYAAAAEIPAIVFLPRGKVSMAQLIQPVANGAIVFALDTDFDGCMEIVKEISATRRHLPRQLDEQPAHRGPEDGRHRDRRSSSTGRCPTGW